MKSRKIIKSIMVNLLGILISLVFVVPSIAVVITSFKSNAEANIISLTLPKKLMFENFAIAIEQGKLILSFKNSLINAFGSVTILIIIVCMAAFVIDRRRNKLSNFLYYFILLGLAIPASNITLIRIMKSIHLMNTRIGVILIYIAINASLALFLCKSFVSSVPREIDEAAIIDGCNSTSLFLRVIMPLLKPIIATLFVLNTMNIWNDFTLPLYFLNNSKMWPMTLAVYNFFGRYSQNWNLVCADVLLTTLPIMIIFILGQKYIVGGLTAGSVKG